MDEVLEPDGFNVLNSCRPAAWQTVFHFHIHVVPRYEDDPLKLPWVPRQRRRQIAGSPARSRRELTWLTRCALSATATSRRWFSTNPPLNLFGDATLPALAACMDEVEASDARALVWRAEGDVFTGGADVKVFQQTSREDADELVRRRCSRRQPARGAGDPDPCPGPRPLPDRRPRGLARLRHALGDRVGAVRPGRGGRRPDAWRRRHPADGRARRARPGRASSS